MGVDTAVADAPHNWLEHGEVPPGAGFRLPGQASAARAPEASAPPPSEPRAPARAAPARTAPRPAAPEPRAEPRPGFAAAPPDAAELAARTIARNAKTLDDLEAALRGFDGCGLKATAKNLCFYRGAPRARLMIIGEAPGREEDLEGRPFVGRAGQLLDKMLAAIGLKEADVHITNVVYWRPPGNRTPTPQESQVCRPFLDRQVELVEPDIVLLLGGAAAKQVLDTTDGIMRIRGKWREIQSGGHAVKTMATLHPAYLLRTPAAKRQAWRDLLAVQAALESGQAK
ncbi:MAG: uracil-DNA glycosylase [Rhizobiales bacterium]|nr:uracil-DNA glycosylase [Hyphomicrobiales bacterium]